MLGGGCSGQFPPACKKGELGAPLPCLLVQAPEMASASSVELFRRARGPGSEATVPSCPDLSCGKRRRCLLGSWAALPHVCNSLGGPLTVLPDVPSHLHCVEWCCLHSPWQGIARALSCSLITAGLESSHESHRRTGPKPCVEEITPPGLFQDLSGTRHPPA